jgi:hypothetical protein
VLGAVKVSKITLVVIALITSSLLLSAAASTLSYSAASTWLGAPALLISGWAAVGHLVTIDDDAPGGFSNEDRDQRFWHESLLALVIKIVLFLLSCWVVFYWPFRAGA